MRLLVVFFGGGVGGDARVCLDLADAWRRMGHDVTLAARATKGSEVMARRSEACGLSLLRYPALGDFLRAQRAAGERYDAVLLHTAGEVPALVSQVLPFLRAKLAPRVGMTLHGPKPLRSLPWTALRRALVRLAVHALDATVVPSRHKVGEWREVFGPDVPVRAIPNPVRPIEPGDRAAARARLGLESDRLWTAFVGLFRPEKGAADAIRAVASLAPRGVGLALAGDGPEMEACRSLASELGAPCRFLGYLEDPADAYRAAQAFVFPSRFESFGLTVMQAAGLGMPIAASDLPVVRDELDFPGAVHRFRPGDPEDLARALADALDASDPAALREMRESVLDLTLPERSARRHLAAIGAE